MAMIEILQYPNPRLKKHAKPVTEFTSEVKQVINDMFETHYSTKNCAALAATQLNFKNPFAITVIDFSINKDEPLCLVNPEIIAAEGEQYEIEGCMSVYPDHIHEKVKRAYKVTVRALDRHGKALEFEADGFMAKCLQHEIDHLHGIVYVDKVSSLKRSRIQNKIKKIVRQQEKE